MLNSNPQVPLEPKLLIDKTIERLETKGWRQGASFDTSGPLCLVQSLGAQASIEEYCIVAMAIKK